MAATPSNMIPLGAKAPSFTLPDTVSGKKLSLSALQGEKGTVVMFICNHCPYVLHINEALVKLAQSYQKKGISFIAISSNDVENYPQDGPDKMKEHAAKVGYPFPYLYDETQDVAKQYQAACTPDFYVFNADLSCVYRGQFDASRPKNDLPATGEDLGKALDLLLDGKVMPEDQQYPSIGCNIKWKN